MKLFSSLGLNITFLQDFSRSAGSLLVSALVIDLPLPYLLSISFSLTALSVGIIFAHFFVYQGETCFVCEWLQGLLKQLFLNQNFPPAMAEGGPARPHAVLKKKKKRFLSTL